ncbi:MAG: RNA 2',3'-cyclic phosphodiesterase [Chloroflexota bacterium]|nr:RNA 2',3'-cyclic phosphodiesterase [Chloroflexota bacterium]
MRLFVAIELPDEVRRALAATVAALSRTGMSGDAVRWVRPDGVHVTLKFLGATPEARLPAVEGALRAAAAAGRPFRLQLAGVGSFGGARNLRVVWAGVAGEVDALAALAARVDGALAPLGFPAEQRPFAAHLTLGRVRDGTPPAARAGIFAALEALPPPPALPIPVDRVSLVRSTLGPGGASYRALAIFPLQ